MKFKDISEAPGDQRAGDPNAGIVRGAGGKFAKGNQSGYQFSKKRGPEGQARDDAPDYRSGDMRRGRIRDLGKARKVAALKQKQADDNVKKSKEVGQLGQFAKHRKDLKVGRVVQHPDGIFYQMTADGWLEVDGVTVNKKDGTFNTDKLKAVPGVYPLAPKDARSMELTDVAKGVKAGPGTLARLKKAGADAVNKAIGGPLASKTRMDPDASTAQKVGAVAGAGLGRAMSAMMGKKTVREPGTGGDIRDRKNNNLRFALEEPLTMFKASKDPDEKIKYAEEWISKLSNFKKKRPDIDGLEDYAIQFAAQLKASGFPKSHPQWYGQFVQKVRAMRESVFNELNAIFEEGGITWEQCGYKVIMSENKGDDVLLLPIKAIDEAIELHELKKLAGV